MSTDCSASDGLYTCTPLPKCCTCRVHAGDEGGAQIIDRLQTYVGRNLVFSNEKWYFYNGTVWTVDQNGRVASQVCRRELNKISAAYQKETGAAVEQNEGEDDDEERPRRKKAEKLVNFNFNAKMSNIMTTLKGYCLDPGFETLLNINRDALPLVNGVILLQSGVLVPHHPKVRWLECEFVFSGKLALSRVVESRRKCSNLSAFASQQLVFCY